MTEESRNLRRSRGSHLLFSLALSRLYIQSRLQKGGPKGQSHDQGLVCCRPYFVSHISLGRLGALAMSGASSKDLWLQSLVSGSLFCVLWRELNLLNFVLPGHVFGFVSGFLVHIGYLGMIGYQTSYSFLMIDSLGDPQFTK